MEPDLPVTAALAIPAAELSWRFSRSSGPGGQGVNTTDSRVELIWDVEGSPILTDDQRERLLDRLAGRLVAGTLVVVASEYRSQRRNRGAARDRLAALVRQALAPPPPRRRPTRPSAGARRRRIEAKKRRSETKRLRRPGDL
ncbi:MAG: aminoacyl-tRNA hydrolase [Kineosporiaceae bacterium]|nr:aminoacyl-tRNA hydrolase [Kineosporiaceae bacterium]